MGPVSDAGEAVGLSAGPGRIGSLDAGARCDFAVFNVDPGDPGDPDPYRTLIEDGPGRCVATVTGGVHTGRDRLANFTPEVPRGR
ncbi:hypothetical protein AB0M95_19105 [Sphaerisporangium sp. NPDC051017]|uniref:hypothetical protein n=1 Tax=Sphaerisporangium sp. NPDC051017 TaxID=3154636 RepID=UPI003418A3DE